LMVTDEDGLLSRLWVSEHGWTHAGQHRAEFNLGYTEESAQLLIDYIADHLSDTPKIELWLTWITGDIEEDCNAAEAAVELSYPLSRLTPGVLSAFCLHDTCAGALCLTIYKE